MPIPHHPHLQRRFSYLPDIRRRHRPILDRDLRPARFWNRPSKIMFVAPVFVPLAQASARRAWPAQFPIRVKAPIGITAASWVQCSNSAANRVHTAVFQRLRTIALPEARNRHQVMRPAATVLMLSSCTNPKARISLQTGVPAARALAGRIAQASDGCKKMRTRRHDCKRGEVIPCGCAQCNPPAQVGVRVIWPFARSRSVHTSVSFRNNTRSGLSDLKPAGVHRGKLAGQAPCKSSTLLKTGKAQSAPEYQCPASIT